MLGAAPPCLPPVRLSRTGAIPVAVESRPWAYSIRKTSATCGVVMYTSEVVKERMMQMGLVDERRRKSSARRSRDEAGR